MKNKELEFEIIDNKILNVLDFDWCIKDIEIKYISHSYMDKSQYTICVSTGWETSELYYKTRDEIVIANRFEKLCQELNKVNPNFKMYFPRCFNMTKIKDIKQSKNLLSNRINIEFKSGESVEFKATKSTAKKLFTDKELIDNVNVEL